MRYYQSRHYELAIHQDAQDDLEQIFSIDEVAAAAFHTIEYCYYVLAILKRDFNYDTKNPRVKRILQTYETLNIPRH